MALQIQQPLVKNSSMPCRRCAARPGGARGEHRPQGGRRSTTGRRPPTGYISLFELSRRRHDPPFKPGGSAGAFRAPGVPGLVCQNHEPGLFQGPRAGGVRGSVQQREKKASAMANRQSSYHPICSLARPPPRAAAPCSPYRVCPPTPLSRANGCGACHGQACGPILRPFALQLAAASSLRPAARSGCASPLQQRHPRACRAQPRRLLHLVLAVGDELLAQGHMLFRDEASGW